MAAVGLALALAGRSPSWPATAAGDFVDGAANVSSSACADEGEETVSSNPLNPRNLVVGSNRWQPADCANIGNVGVGPSGTTTCAVFESHDGGRSWSGRRLGADGLGTTPNPLPNPLPVVGALPKEFSDPGNLIAADQNTVWDRQGNVYYDCIYFGLGQASPQVWIFKSGDGGRTWGPKMVAFDEAGTQIQIDREFLAIDRSGGPRDGALYLTYETMFYQAWLPQVYAESSTDGGRTWSPHARVDSDALEAMWDPRQFPQVGADGALHVVYASAPLTSPCPCDSSTPALVLATSRDGGKTFSQHVVEPAAHRITSQDEAFSYFQELISAFAASPVDPGRLVVAWPDSRSGEDRILLRQSLDGGQTWGAAVDPTDDPPGRGNSHDHPALAFLPDGRLLLAWRDRRYGGGTLTSPWDLFLRVGEPAGAGLNFGPVTRITASTQPPTTGHHGNMPSEYLGVFGDAAGANLAWDQLSADGVSTDNFFRHVPIAQLGSAPTAEVTPTGGLPDTSRSLPAAGALGLAALTALTFAVLRRRRRSAPDS